MRSFKMVALIGATLLVLAVAFAGVAMAEGGVGAPVVISGGALDSVQIVLDFSETHDTALLAPDAELVANGAWQQSFQGRDAIGEFFGARYGEHELLGQPYVEPLRLIAVGENTVICDYIFHANVFPTDRFLEDNMVVSWPVEVPMVSIYEIENGQIMSALLYEAPTAPPLPQGGIG